MKDYLGIELERAIEKTIEDDTDNFFSISPLLEEGFNKTKNPSFIFYKELYQKKEDQAIATRKAYVMARDSRLGLYIAHKRGLNKAFSFIVSRLLTHPERERVLSSCLLWACQLKDTKFAVKALSFGVPKLASYKGNLPMITAAKHGALEIAKLLEKNGADRHAMGEGGLKIALENQDKQAMKFFGYQADIRNIEQSFIDNNLATKANVCAIKFLVEKGVPYFKRDISTLRKLAKAIKDTRPESYRKEMAEIFSWYPHQHMKYMDCDYELGEFARLDKKRPLYNKISKALSQGHKEDVQI